MVCHYRLVLVFTLSSIQLSRSGYDQEEKRYIWRNGPDSVGTLNPNNLHGGAEDLDSSDYVFHVEEGWPDPGKKLGQPSAVSFDRDGNVVIFHRGDRVWDANTFLINNVYNQRGLGPITQPTLVKFNASSGHMMEEWGRNLFYLPHGLTIDTNNNVWVTDVALHQVFKFALGSDKPLLVLGIAFVPGNDHEHFCKPTDVAIMSNGDFFVSDGYCNSRILKFSKNGKLLMQWGRNSLQGAVLGDSRLPPYEFSVPHALTLAEDKELLCVADRENGRIQCFNCHNGTFIMQFHSQEMGSRIFSVAYSPAQGGLLYIINGPEFTGVGLVSGFIISLKHKQFVGAFRPNQALNNPHDLAVTADGNEIYVVEFRPFKVWKFVNGYVNNTSSALKTTASSSTSTVKPVVTSQHG